ncbi:unnamed protein product, partial [Urochloa humidicola]
VNEEKLAEVYWQPEEWPPREAEVTKMGTEQVQTNCCK